MWTILRNVISRRDPAPDSLWILVPLGNPGDEYADTRHNLGRLVLQRWMVDRGRKSCCLRTFRTGNLYSLGGSCLALVPSTYMNLSGQTCVEAVAAGFDPNRLVLLHDDKDLPLGLGRFRLDGSSAGHNGLASVFECLGTQEIPRLRLGIGPFRRPLHEFVLGSWTEEEWVVIRDLDGPFARFLDLLAAAKNLGVLAGEVNAQRFWTPLATPSAPPDYPERL